MNETDVRETIIRPFLHRLGYAHGTDADIRTEQTFRYAKAFLGRKNPKKDPDLVGRADYILEVIGFDRWVAEAKAPNERLDRDSIEQAHTYAAHPEVGAAFFLLSNGRESVIYRTGALSSPVMSWSWEQTEEMFLAVFNLIGPEAIKRRASVLKADPGKPLGRGLASYLKVIGGTVVYEDHSSSHPLIPMGDVNGLELPFTGGFVARAEDGRLHAHVEVAPAAPMMKELNALLDIDNRYDFFSADEYISTDPTAPTIFSNVVRAHIAAGNAITLPGMGRIALPYGFRFAAGTEAIGYVEAGKFRGTMQIAYDVTLEGLTPIMRQALRQQFGDIPISARLTGGGRFEVEYLS